MLLLLLLLLALVLVLVLMRVGVHVLWCVGRYQVDHWPTTKIFSGGPARAHTITGYVFLDDYEGRFSAEVGEMCQL